MHAQWVDAHKYAFMLQHLMVTIQDFLVLSDDDEQNGAKKSLALVNRTAKSCDDNMICIWLQECRNRR